MAQMNLFFNTVSRGRYSTLNYEGVGPNYDAYLIAQARQAIAGQPFTTNLQEFATDPTQMFTGGNMKGIMTYMQCANNVACYTMTAQSQYAKELTKATEIAKAEQDRGFLPMKKNGKIIQPSAIVSNAMSQIDQLGTQVIMNVDTNGTMESGLAQITAGAGINIAARSFNYMLADSKGKDAIQNKNDEFPFSLSYNLNTGIGISTAGIPGVTTTGVGGAGPNGLQIGNTCASGGFVVNTQGVAVLVNGQKTQCTPGSASLY
jgi:hypothetical protein